MSWADTLTERGRILRRERSHEYRQRNYNTGLIHGKGDRVTVPDDIVRLETHVPCGYCGTRAACKHRPWA